MWGIYARHDDFIVVWSMNVFAVFIRIAREANNQYILQDFFYISLEDKIIALGGLFLQMSLVLGVN